MNSFKKLLGLLKQDSPAESQAVNGRKSCRDPDGATLIDFGHGDNWTVRDAFEGTQVFGAIGSGKTSGSGQALAEAFLNAGFGGLVLTAKPGELEEWKWYMERVHKETGRNPDDLIEFSPSSGKRFNFLEYERQNGGEGAGLVDNLVSLFFAIMEVDERANDQVGGDPIWKRTSKQLLRNTIGILLLADKKLTIQNINAIISSSPKVPGQGDDPEWQSGSFLYECMFNASSRIEGDESTEDYELICQYWNETFPDLAPETRSSVILTFSSMADSLMRAPLRELFSRDCNLTPEDTHRGKVILLNLPVKTFNEVGTIAQVLFKYCCQRATERRPAASQTPVFLWADESQYFINSYDMHFQQTARSSRAATVYLSQNISNYYARLSGTRGRPEADSLLGNFQTKIFHANGDNVTNLWAAETISKDWTTKTDTQTSISRNEAWGGTKQPASSSQFNMSRQRIIEYQVQPVQFTRLKKGGPPNNQEVEAIVFQAGRTFSHGKSFAKVTFKQKPRSQHG